MFICKNIYNHTIAVFRWEEKMTRLLFISLSYDTKIVKIFIYFHYRNDFPWSKDFLFWENFEYQIDVPFKSIINIAVVNTKFALRWNYIMKVISNRVRSVVSLTASCCVRQCWCIQPHCKNMTTIHINTMMRGMLTGYLNESTEFQLCIYLLYMYQCVLSVPVQN